MLFLDQTLLLLLPAVLLSLFAQWKVKSTFGTYSKVRSSRGMSGGEAARTLARLEQVPVSVQAGRGYLSDHFDPHTNSLVLSPEVFSGQSLASLGVAAHELGHALQKKNGYIPLALRSGLVPLANFGSQFSMILFFVGIIASIEPLQIGGIALFSLAVLFTLVTLPVEFDASARAVKMLKNHGMVSEQELPAVKKVLTAAALTYVAAAVMAIVQLLRLILIARRDD
jgi:uncharacterized protein